MRVLLLIFLALVMLHGSEARFSNSQFTIDAPASKDDDNGAVVQLSLPMTDGYQAHVNVRTGAYPGTIEDYDRTSQSQIKEMGFTVIKNEIGTDRITTEYTGQRNRRDMHWYSLVIKKKDTIYLITAEAREKDWESQKAALLQSVNSFTLKE